MPTVFTQLAHHRLVPVVSLDSAADAPPLAAALIAGNLPIIEITFRTPAAEAAIRAVAKTPNLLVGAGTVLNIATAQRAIDAGAAFIVTPGFSPKLVEFCLNKKIPIIPGASTGTDLQLAVGEYDLKLLKFFPAESLGGLPTLKALSAPFPTVRFLPTGGITPHNLKAYLTTPQVQAVGGSWMAPPQLIAAKDYDQITKLTANSVAIAHELSGPS